MVALVSESNIRVEFDLGDAARPSAAHAGRYAAYHGGYHCMVRLLKRAVNEAAGEKTPEA